MASTEGPPQLKFEGKIKMLGKCVPEKTLITPLESTAYSRFLVFALIKGLWKVVMAPTL